MSQVKINSSWTIGGVKSIDLKYSGHVIWTGLGPTFMAAQYLVDVLWGQRIKLIQVASNSELRENQWNDLLFFEIVPSHCFGASEASKIDWLKN